MVIIAAQDGYKGRLAPAWDLCKARTAHPVEAAPACLSTRRRMRVGSPKIGQSRAEYPIRYIASSSIFSYLSQTAVRVTAPLVSERAKRLTETETF